MLRSLRSRIMAVVLGIIVVTAFTFLYFAQKAIERALVAAEEDAARNVLRLTMLSVQGEYEGLRQLRTSLLEAHKRELRDLVSVEEGFIRSAYGDSSSGRVTETAAQRRALEGLRVMTFGDGDYLWVSNYASVLISHPDPALNGADFSRVTDVKGNLIVPPMVELARKEGQGYHSYWWHRLGRQEPIEKLSYFKDFPQWRWVIGTGFYVDDAELEYKRGLDGALERLAATLTRVRIARTGYLFLFDRDRRMLIHPVLERGMDASRLLDPGTGKPILDELIKAAATPDKPFEYLWDMPSHKGQYRYWKESYVTSFEPMGWYLCSSVYRDEIYQPVHRLRSSLFLLSLLFLAVATFLSLVLTRRLTGPVERMVEQVSGVASLDLTIRFEERSGLVELDRLASYLNRMVRAFAAAIAQVKGAGLNVTSSTAQLAEIAAAHEEEVNGQRAATDRAAEAVQGIVAAMAELEFTLQQALALFRQAADVAGSGRAGLTRMGEAMRQMEEASGRVSARLTMINESAETITTVVTTITRVADQTNLLSLNAGIEAEKAGELGRGFAVVAREVRRLADQTAVAAVDIEQMVRQMHDAVTGGVAEMAAFVSDVRHSADDVDGIGREMSHIIEQFEALSPMLEQVRAAMELQAASATGVEGVMADLSSEMTAAVQSLRRSYAAIEVLNQAADGLGQEMGHFTVDGEGGRGPIAPSAGGAVVTDAGEPTAPAPTSDR